MRYDQNCNYCKYKFSFKFPYRCWAQVAKVIYNASVKRMAPVNSIVFMFQNKEWVIEDNTDILRDNEIVRDQDYLSIDLVEPMTDVEAHVITNNDYRWPSGSAHTAYRNLRLLQDMPSFREKKDMRIECFDVRTGIDHLCGVRKIQHGDKTILFLEEAWQCED